MKRDSFVFYRSFFEACECLEDKDKLDFYNLVFNYVFNDKIIETNGTAKAMFMMSKPNIDNALKKYNASVENGKKGGRPKKISSVKDKPNNNPTITQDKPNNNLDETQHEPNQNLNVYVYDDVNDNDNVDVYENANDDVYVNEDDNKDITATKVTDDKLNNFIKLAIDYLNQKTNKRYTYDTKDTVKFLKALFKSKTDIEDIKKVVDLKCYEWTNTEYEKYLRPATLFGSKFGTYLEDANNGNYKVNQQDVANKILNDLKDVEW